MKAAGERVHNAAVRAEQEARKLPGASLAAGMAGGMPAAAEAASIAAARAFERLPGASRAMGLAAESVEGTLGSKATDGLREQVTGVAAQLGSIVAKAAGMDNGARLVDHAVVNIGTGRGHSAFDVIEALRGRSENRSRSTSSPVELAIPRTWSPPRIWPRVCWDGARG